MTDDTLRQECEKLLDSLEATYSDVTLYGGTLVDVDKKYKADCAKILAFARAQQAKGIKEMANEASRRAYMVGMNEPLRINHLYQFKEWLESQATAREQVHV